MSETKQRRSSKHLIPVIRILNPFDTRQQERTTLAWSSKKTLDKYFPVVERHAVIVSVSGRIVQPDQFAATYLDKTDNIVVCPIPAGGGGGKQILGMIAMMAIAIAAPMAAPWLVGDFGMLGGIVGSGVLGTSIVTAGLTVAGSMLVNAVFAPPKPTSKASDISTSYGIDGAKNTSVEGIPVPVCYGKFRTGGNILGTYVTNDADDNQTLYMLISAGEGPIASITDIELNDNPITDYHDVEVQTRLGLAANQQDVIPWFNDTIRAVNKSQRLTSDWFYSTTTAPVDKLRLDFTAPSGLAEIDTKSGAAKAYSVDIDVEYRKVGDIDWTTMPIEGDIESWSVATYDNGVWWKGPVGGMLATASEAAYLNKVGTIITKSDGSKAARYPSYGKGTKISASKKSAIRRSYTTSQLDQVNYEVRVRRATPKSTKDNIIDDLYLADINEIMLADIVYPNTALLALKIKMTDQLSGIPTVTYLHGGKMVSVYRDGAWGQEASTNPAWIVWDILTNKRYGGGMPTSRLDFVAFQEFADYCDSKKLTWNGPIESESNVWDASQMVLRLGHSQIVPSGTRYTVITEKPAAPVMMFSVANMIEGSYKETWLGRADRANEIDVTFYDRTDKYKERTIKVCDPAALASGAPQRNSAITLYGVVDYDRAYQEAQLQLNLNHYILKTITFGAPLEAIACRVGDLIYVQTDLTDWAQAGRFEAGSTTSVMKLDRPVTMVAGKSYKLLTMRDAVQRATCTVTKVIGNSVFLSGYSESIIAKRAKMGGKDVSIDGTFDTGIIVDDSTGITAGQTCTLWDTDVIEEYSVVTAAGTPTTVTLQAPCSSAPAQFSQWMFGEAEKVKKPFRIKAISGSSEYRRDITAIEYRDEVYDTTRYSGSQPVALNPDTPIGPASSMTVYEETYVEGDAVVSSVVSSWVASTVGLYGGADVYVQKNGGPAELLVNAKNRTSATIVASRGDSLTVRAVAYDIFGKRSQYELAPVATYAVIGEAQGIDVASPTGAGFIWAGRDCKINWRYNSTTHSYEFGSEPNGADAGSLDPHFKDYEIRVYDGMHSTLRRTEYTTDNSYVYIYDKNFSDGLTRDLVFEVRQRDIFNNLSNPSVLEAHNPAPTIKSSTADPTFNSATISYEHSGDPDFAGVQVWVSEQASDLNNLDAATAAGLMVYSGPDTSIVVGSLMFNMTHYYRIAAFDAFGTAGMVPTAVRTFKTAYFDVNTIKDQMIPVAKFAKEIDPVGLVDVLPNPATWVRPLVVMLTTDGKLYRLQGGAWTSAIPAADVTGQIVASQIKDAAITTAKFAQGLSPVGVVSALPVVAGYAGPTVVTLTTDGKLYRLVGGAWTAAVPAVDVTGQLTDAQIKDVTAAKIGGKLTDSQIDTVSAAKLTGTITGTQITDGAISTAKLAAGAVTANEIGASAIVAGKIATDAITADKIKAGEVSAAKLAVGAVTADAIAADAITAAKIKAGEVTAGKIAANAITSSNIAADAITSAHIAAGAVSADEIAAGAISTAKLAAGAVTATEIAANAITSAKIATGAVTADSIAANAITTGKIAAGAISATEIAANAITSAKLATTQLLTLSAQIGDGLIVNAKIGNAEVSTLKIAGQAVTVPAASFSSWGVTCHKGETSIQTLTFSSSGAPVTVMFAAQLDPVQYQVTSADGSPVGMSPGATGLALYRNGSQIVSTGGPSSFFVQDNPSAGIVTYELKAVNYGATPEASSGAAYNRIINILETKR